MTYHNISSETRPMKETVCDTSTHLGCRMIKIGINWRTAMWSRYAEKPPRFVEYHGLPLSLAAPWPFNYILQLSIQLYSKAGRQTDTVRHIVVKKIFLKISYLKSYVKNTKKLCILRECIAEILFLKEQKKSRNFHLVVNLYHQAMNLTLKTKILQLWAKTVGGSGDEWDIACYCLTNLWK